MSTASMNSPASDLTGQRAIARSLPEAIGVTGRRNRAWSLGVLAACGRRRDWACITPGSPVTAGRLMGPVSILPAKRRSGQNHYADDRLDWSVIWLAAGARGT